MKKFIAIILLLSLGVLVWLIVLYSQIRGDIQNIVDYNPPLTTQIFDRNNKLLANIFRTEHRLYVKYKDIPPRIIESLVAIEDTMFFEHNGINLQAISRAFIKDVKAMKMVEGASTITQQLVKTMLLSRDKKIIRKIKEVLLSYKLETILTKEEILERYLNQIYFGHGYYGVKTAAKGYFHKELRELTTKEMAILMGLPKAPSFYAPTKNLKFSLSRANQVIRRLEKLGWISKAEKDKATNEIPTIYNESLVLNKAPYVVSTIIKELKNNITNLKSGGYKIISTIDLQAQEIARDAITHGYNLIKKRDDEEKYTKSLNGALLSVENSTGKILALIGGVDYKKSSFNRVTQSKRQPGSSVKPFLYQTAINMGYSTVSKLADISRSYDYTINDTNTSKKDINQTKNEDEDKKWNPRNYSNTVKGLVTIREALVHSKNLATINLVTDIGVSNVSKNLRHYGFKNIPSDLSIALGSFGISMIDLSELFTIFSNYGTKVKPYLISQIINSGDEVLEMTTTKKYYMEESQSYIMTSIMQDVVKRGTGRKARVRGIEIAGKTGTTNNNIDAWFCGYSPTIQTQVWFGNDDNKPMKKSETGGRSAGPVFRYFYEHWMKVHPEIKRKFDIPKGVFTVNYKGKDEVFTKKSNASSLNINKIFQENSNVLF